MAIQVCFIQHAAEHVLIKPIARYLKEEGIELIFVCIGVQAQQEYEKDGFQTHFISDVFGQPNAFTEEELAAIDQKYGPPGIKSIAYSDIRFSYLLRGDPSQMSQVIAGAYQFWEEFLHENKVDFFLANETASFATRTAHAVARNRGIPFADIQTGPSDDHFLMRDVGEIMMWKEFLRALKSRTEKKLDDSQKTVVLNFIEKRVTKSSAIPVRFAPQNVISSLKSIASSWKWDTQKTRKKDPILVGSLRHGRYKLWKRLCWKYLTQRFFRYNPLGNERYVYFPFYSGEETSYLCTDPYWARHEVDLIEEVARCLPLGYKLYVKEHPLNPGDIPFGSLRRLQKNQNIRVLHPSVDAQTLIENSRAVVVLQGTTGWEAFLRKKPVVVLSKTYFAYSPIVYRARSISKLEEVLWRAIREGPEAYRKYEEEWFWFIYTAITTCGEGVRARSRPPYGFPTDPENAKKMARFITRKIKRDVGRRSQGAV